MNETGTEIARHDERGDCCLQMDGKGFAGGEGRRLLREVVAVVDAVEDWERASESLTERKRDVCIRK